ncbi:MAG TPA: FAD-binding oxidoreductase [Actinomycetes bacterium]|nr:FAD-binding oxidoreductase [Actinomycetes bacterium]
MTGSTGSTGSTTGGGSPLELDPGFQGIAIHPGEPGYDASRAVYNGSIDRRPALIVRPSGTADVVDAVNAARRAGLPVAARGGGHSVAGNGVTEGGVQIDMSSLKGTWVDPARHRARTNAGSLWGEFDRETQRYGLATPGGRVTTTGVAGFTTGGGYGWLSPTFGLTCDNLISAEVVTADGRVVTASEDENPDLFWGLRGGSSNFGLATSFELAVHPVGPTVLAGMLIHQLDTAVEVIMTYRDYVEQMPEELVTGVAIVQAPPAEFVPAEMVGVPVLGILVLWIGDPDEGRTAVNGLRRIGPPLMDLVQPMPYTTFQTLLDPFNPRGQHNYHRGEHLSGLPDAAIEAYVEAAPQTLSPLTQAVIFRHGGAVARVPEMAMAASHRDAAYMAHPITAWSDPADTAENMAWARQFSEAMRPFTTGGLYLNFETETTPEIVRRGFTAEKFDRLVELKDRWDPENLFRVNQNIPPSGRVTLPEPREAAAEVTQEQR